ncbi:hypothetical protein NX059_004017 [Plenodomus lindquistii]|nr:hypothetical protein NX059_004017 [Plenodomus lindquistii]
MASCSLLQTLCMQTHARLCTQGDACLYWRRTTRERFGYCTKGPTGSDRAPSSLVSLYAHLVLSPNITPRTTMSSSPERLMVDTREAPSTGFSLTTSVQPWQGDSLTTVVTESEIIRYSGAGVIPGATNMRGAWAIVINLDSEGFLPDGPRENVSTTVSSMLPTATLTTSSISVSATDEVHILHDITAIPTPRKNLSRGSLTFIILGSFIGVIVVLAAIILCSVHIARKHARRKKRKTVQDAALEEVLQSGTISSKGQEIGSARLQEAPKRKWGAEEFAIHVIKEAGPTQSSLRERAQEERVLLESMFERDRDNFNRNNGGYA